MRYRIRFNKTRGNPGRGTPDHVWRVFDESGKEWLAKHVKINVPSYGEKEEYSEDWNIVCYGFMEIEQKTHTIIIF